MNYKKICYISIIAILGFLVVLGAISEIVGIKLCLLQYVVDSVTSPLVLGIGIVYALLFGSVYTSFNRMMSKKMLQYSVIGLGFGMNVEKALESGWEVMSITIVSVFATLFLGWIIGRRILRVNAETSFLLSSGTAICGGSAIAAIGSQINAKSENLSMALGVVFILNAVALFIFPAIGSALGMSVKQFGMWAAIAIHDTSSVVGAGTAYDQMHPELVVSQGVSALELSTTIKLTRALWIVVLVLLTPLLYRSRNNASVARPWYKSIPSFIVWFIVAILFNTYVLSNSYVLGEEMSKLGSILSSCLNIFSKHIITLSMFFIGASLTRNTFKAIGFRPLLQGILLWLCVSFVSLAYILNC